MHLKKEVTSEGELADLHDYKQQRYYSVTSIFSNDMKLYEIRFVIIVHSSMISKYSGKRSL